MTTDNILFFDTETTGLPPKNAKWDEDFNEFPYLCEIAWIFGRKTESHIIRPDGWIIPEDATKIHGISNDYAVEHGEPLSEVLEKFVSDCSNAALICGHNIYFDISVIKANIIRHLGREFYNASNAEFALFKGKRIDTMRSSMKWVDARFSSGRLKFPSLQELFSRCFPEETFDAHKALDDVKAVVRCLPILVDEGLVELKVKEYPAEPKLFERPVSSDSVPETPKPVPETPKPVPETPKPVPETPKTVPNSRETVPDAQNNVAAKIVRNIEESAKAVVDAQSAINDALRNNLLNEENF